MGPTGTVSHQPMIKNPWDLQDILIILQQHSVHMQKVELVIMLTKEMVHPVILVDSIQVILAEDQQEVVLVEIALGNGPSGDNGGFCFGEPQGPQGS